jgi:hypothetical protein
MRRKVGDVNLPRNVTLGIRVLVNVNAYAPTLEGDTDAHNSS